MITLAWTSRSSIPPEILDNQQRFGGQIFQFEEVMSMVIYAKIRPAYVWIAPGKSARSTGCLRALGCFFLGWWSPPGLFYTSVAIVKNLMGGIDLTGILVELPGTQEHDDALRQWQAVKRRQRYVTWGFLGAYILLALDFCLRK